MSRYKFRGKSHVDYHNTHAGVYNHGPRLDGTRPTTSRNDDFRGRSASEEIQRKEPVVLKEERGSAQEYKDYGMWIGYAIKIDHEFGDRKSIRALGKIIGKGQLGALTEKTFVDEFMRKDRSLILFDEPNDHIITVKTRGEFLEFKSKNGRKDCRFFQVQDIGIEEAAGIERRFAGTRASYSDYALESVLALGKTGQAADLAPAPGEFTSSPINGKTYGMEFYPDKKALRVLGEMVWCGSDLFQAQKMMSSHAYDKAFCVVSTVGGKHYILKTEMELVMFESRMSLQRQDVFYRVLKPLSPAERADIGRAAIPGRLQFEGYTRADSNI